MWGYEEEDRLATPSEACREWAWNVGSETRYANQQWLLTDYDTWERNPHYHGHAQEHPHDAEARMDYEREMQSGFESFEYEERPRRTVTEGANFVAQDIDDDIPF